jgi:2-polyprenyl-3-methyl-5-hydroxy-6-metoxy-1,4-benzoquinol methylase
LIYQFATRWNQKSRILSQYFDESEIFELMGDPMASECEIFAYPKGSFGRSLQSRSLRPFLAQKHFDRGASNYQSRQRSGFWSLLKSVEKSLYGDWIKNLKGSLLNVGSCTLFSDTGMSSSLQITNVDLSEKMLASAPGSSKPILGNFETHSFEKKDYNAIALIGVLEFMVNPALALRKSFELLSPGGRLIVFAPLKSFLSSLYKNFHSEQNVPISLFTEGELRKSLEDAGFRVVSIRKLPFWVIAIDCEKK